MTQVTDMRLHNNNLTGALPPWLFQHPHLVSCWLQNNSFTGTPLQDPVNATHLQLLLLENNNFTGTIHHSFGTGMPRLVTFTFSNNDFSGPLPSSMSNMTRLGTIVGIGNKLNGPLPSLGQWPALKVVVLAGNRLTGVIPVSLGRSRNLTTLVLRGNRLNGTLPREFAFNPQLNRFDVTAQQDLFGPLPPFGSQNRALRQVELGQNRLNGTVSGALLTLPTLTRLTLDRNFLSCALPNDECTAQSVDILVGNRFECPVPQLIQERDRHGKIPGSEYACGAERWVGNLEPNPLRALLSPVGTLIVALAGFGMSAVLFHRRRPISEAQGMARTSVKAEVAGVLDFLRWTVRIGSMLALIALIMVPVYWTTPSPLACASVLRLSAAYKDGVATSGWMVAGGLAVVCVLLVWTTVQHAQKRQRHAYESPLRVLMTPHDGAHPGEDHGYRFAVLKEDADDLLRPGTIRLPRDPEAVLWKNAVGRHSHQSLKSKTGMPTNGCTKGCAEASCRGACVAFGAIVGSMAFALVPNVVYILVELDTIEVSVTLKAAIMAGAAFMKTVASTVVVPVAANIASMAWRPTSRFMHGSVRTTIMVWLIFFNMLGWPILGVVFLSPLCLKEWLGTTGMIEGFQPELVNVTFSFPFCSQTCHSGQPDCPEAGGFAGCNAVGEWPSMAQYRPDFRWNKSCPSTVVEIYGPLFFLVFCYGILTSAFGLFRHTAAYARLSTTARTAWGTCKQKFVCGRTPKVCRERCRCCRPSRSRRLDERTMHVTQLYVAGALDIAIIASFGFSYPLVSLAGLIRLVLQEYAMRTALPVVATIGGRNLQMEGVAGLPVPAIVAILAVNTAMYLSIFGPAGMMRLTTFEWLGPPMIGAVGVVSIPWVVPWWSGRHDEPSDADSRRKNSMEMPLRRGSLDERSLEESEERAERELAVCASFEESFREWQEHEKASTTTTTEETTRGCRENRDEDGGEYSSL